MSLWKIGLYGFPGSGPIAQKRSVFVIDEMVKAIEADKQLAICCLSEMQAVTFNSAKEHPCADPGKRRSLFCRNHVDFAGAFFAPQLATACRFVQHPELFSGYRYAGYLSFHQVVSNGLHRTIWIGNRFVHFPCQ
jgi:hypothetical protein